MATSTEIPAVFAYNETLLYDSFAIYSGSLFAGTPLQGKVLNRYIYSTSTPYVAISAKNCTTCPGASGVFSPEDSSTYTKIGGPAVETFGGTPGNPIETLNGTWINDRVCLSEDFDFTCVKNASIFVVESESLSQ